MIMKQAQVQASTVMTNKSQYSGEIKLGAAKRISYGQLQDFCY